MSEHTDFAAIMGQVAERLLPEFMPLNKGMSTSKEQRWGKKGSFSVRLDEGTWYDHEDQHGGGVLDLLRTYKGLEKPEAVEWLVEQGLVERRNEQPKEKFAGFMDRHPVAIFDYHDDRGHLAYQVLKFPKDTDGPRYMQRRPHPDGGWIWGLRQDRYGKVRSGDWFKAKKDKQYGEEADLPETRWWLFHRDEVIKARADGKPVVLVEGEKDVETLRGWGFVATTNQGGAKNWKPELDEDLAGADVVVCSDLDAAGSARTALRGAALRGIAKSVRVIDLSLHWKDHPEKADVSDWKDKAGDGREVRRDSQEGSRLDAHASKIPVWRLHTRSASSAKRHTRLPDRRLVHRARPFCRRRPIRQRQDVLHAPRGHVRGARTGLFPVSGETRRRHLSGRRRWARNSQAICRIHEASRRQ